MVNNVNPNQIAPWKQSDQDSLCLLSVMKLVWGAFLNTHSRCNKQMTFPGEIFILIAHNFL